MTQSEQKFIRVRNGKTGVERNVPANTLTMGVHLHADEYVVPHQIKENWMLELITNLIKAEELARIKARLENLDEWAKQTAGHIPSFHLAEMNQGKYPFGMNFEEQGRFRQENRNALSIYSIAIQYLERGRTPDEIKEILQERHGNSGAKDALTDQTQRHKQLLDAVGEL